MLASLASGLLGYAYQIVISKLLSAADFGMVSALMALMSILIVPVGAYTMVLTRNYAAYHARRDLPGLSYLYKGSWKQVSVAAAMVIIGVISLWPALGKYLNTPPGAYSLVFSLLVAITVLTPPNAAFFQGTQRFNWVAVNGIIGQFGKLVFGALFIAWGWSVNGAMLGIILATFFVLMLNTKVVLACLSSARNQKHIEQESRETFRTVFPVLVANVAFTALSQLDLVLVRANFEAEAAGEFAVAAIFGKAVMYLPGAIVIALYPMVAENEANKKSSVGLLFQGLVLAIVLSAAFGALYYLISDKLIELIYGQKYAESIEVLRYYSLAMIPMAIVMVMEFFLMAKRRVLFAYLMLVVVPIEVLLVEIYASSLLQVVWIMAFCGWMLVIVGFMILLWQNKALAMQLVRKTSDK